MTADNPNKTMAGKPLTVTVNNQKFMRKAIKTHFITTQDSYLDIIHKYVGPIHRENDILAVSEKVISVTQNRLVYKSHIRVGTLAKILSKFVHVTPAGKGVGNPYKMQVAIESAGVLRILIGALLAAITRPLGIKGIFYKVVGNEVWAIDGFNDLAFDYYDDKGVLTPENPTEICNVIQNELGIKTIIVDANDINVEILGKSQGVYLSDDTIKQILQDNPAGQSNEQTPFILVREVE
ncbi:coenzyme F420-0:L-glutamate ligase [Natranaerobius thermophilus]|uniref:Asparagine synthase (Glutamine-hydrolyzing) n=1 Tax=Natranaerobius thermophilus (strain ATCC BAA-1301 / DSM 18059 / JW/NM-WN-LF) TaxID=457570 RepID=B2A672_NATTJ|nr:coenzyme F420-0:L-glutamate ligase [Natranaerobius thermophilus]ACB84083.1 asparagine synthase (glutamine-hydrolyzing) [Natranaerobius thermophilus JW/NM-WN-LF]